MVGCLVVAYPIFEDLYQHVGKWIWGECVPQALANGTVQAKPDPLVVGNGLEGVQHAIDVQKNGVSAKKVVVAV